IGGLAAAIALKDKLNYNDFDMYEKAHDVGGTWRENVYPGCACDVPSHWYSLSTDWNPEWSRQYSSQPEILKYLQNVAKRRELAQKIKFGYKLVHGAWDDLLKHYVLLFEVSDRDGNVLREEEVIAKVVFAAMGGLHVPAFPDIPGYKSFHGDVWHAAQWRHDVELKGKRVAIIGNGCSGAQIVPAISEDPSVEVVNFCRTPSWFFPRVSRHPPWPFQWMFSFLPFAAALYRFWIYFTSDVRYFVWSNHGRWLRRLVQGVARKYIRSKAPKHLHDKLIPKYDFGCKRIIVDPGYLSSLNRPNVQTEWDGIECITPEGIKTKSGKLHELDVIVSATGFDLGATAPPLVGRKHSVREYFEAHGGPTAYRGTTIPGFPNMFIVLGPNVASGHGSAIFVMECQVNYALQLVKPILSGETEAVEVTEDATDKYNAVIQSHLKDTAWASCFSYYNQQGGKNVAMYPGSLTYFWTQMRRPIWSDYIMTRVAMNGKKTD
ncbi:FAD/NAD-P-binding domain-containing protein, partial [Clavulina sp. PMI_390]